MRGDPYQRSQRLFVFAIHVLLALALNIVFFEEDEECVYGCDHHMPAGIDDRKTLQPTCAVCPAELDWETCVTETGWFGDANLHPVDGARMCVDEAMPGLSTSLISLLIVLPIYLGLSRLVSGRPHRQTSADTIC